MSSRVRIGGREVEVDVAVHGDDLVVRVGGATHRLSIERGRPGLAEAVLDGERVRFGWSRRDGGYLITLDGTALPVAVIDERAQLAARAAPKRSGAVVRAPLPGLVRAILAEPGAAVRRGDPLVTLDAMKMENEIPSPVDGTVLRIHVEAGAPVEKDAVLVTLGGRE